MQYLEKSLGLLYCKIFLYLLILCLSLAKKCSSRLILSKNRILLLKMTTMNYQLDANIYFPLWWDVLDFRVDE